jgi:hypothetical protein
MKEIKEKQYKIFEMVSSLKDKHAVDEQEKVKLLKFPKETTQEPPKVSGIAGRNLGSPLNVNQQNPDNYAKVFKSEEGGSKR